MGRVYAYIVQPALFPQRLRFLPYRIKVSVCGEQLQKHLAENTQGIDCVINLR